MSDRLLHYAQRLASLSSVDEVLSELCSEAIALTGARRAFASYCLPRQAWERGIHVQSDGQATEAVKPAARSALFAIHRRLAWRPGTVELARSDETTAMFAGLECDHHEGTLCAVPIVHRTHRVWGELVVVARESLFAHADVLQRLAAQASVALESTQRLTFARRDQDRLLLLAEATDDALYEWDIDSRDFWWGGGIRRLVGSDADPVENTARWKLDRIHPDDADRTRASFDEARFSKAMRWHAEYRFRRADGTYIDVEDRGYFLRDVEGRAYRIIGSMRDVTAMKSLLAREKQARAEAESASRAKDEFLAMLGHELRNPLAPIVTGLELLRLRDDPVSTRQITVLQRQAQHLIRLVDDLLDISRITHGKIELKKERLDLKNVIAAAIETARPLIDSRMQQLQVEVPNGAFETIADRARLAQAISNLLNNAAKYTEPRGTITVIGRRVDDWIEIVVRDTGIGIEPHMLPHVFNMFVQERQALDRSQGGLGIGLAIVRSLVELHGGKVSAHSAGRGHGSEFMLRIPAATERTDEAAPRTRQGSTPQQRRKIMVVDDNVDAAEMLAILLERLGNETRVAHDAVHALKIVEDFGPELAVVDIGLPEIDGYELARRLRARPGADMLRLVALTGYGQPSDRQRSKTAGFDEHLVKPVALDTLQGVIAKLASP